MWYPLAGSINLDCHYVLYVHPSCSLLHAFLVKTLEGQHAEWEWGWATYAYLFIRISNNSYMFEDRERERDPELDGHRLCMQSKIWELMYTWGSNATAKLSYISKHVCIRIYIILLCILSLTRPQSCSALSIDVCQVVSINLCNIV